MLLDNIAEARIQEAIERGEFDELPGSGQPLTLDDDSAVPEELRLAYRILKNAGFVPPEIALRREIANAEDLLRAATADSEAAQLASRRLALLRLQLSLSRGGADRCFDPLYEQRLAERLSRR